MKKFLVIFIALVSFLDNKAQNETCPEGAIQVIVAITVDYFGSETGFFINENPQSIPYNGVGDPISNLGSVMYSVFPGTYPDYLQGQTFFETVCLPGGCYSLSFYDEWGDGMGFTNGSYQLLIGDSVVVSGGGNFGQWDSHVFCVSLDTQISPVFGCMDSTACNYYPGATVDDGTCLFPGSPCQHENPLITNGVFSEDCVCEGNIIYGCVDSLAVNFNPLAVISDESCYYLPGCTMSWACNFNSLADFDDGSCEFLSCLEIGCMDENANNYNPLANTPDLSLCVYESPSFEVIQNCKEITFINTTPEASGSSFSWQFGDGSPDVSNQDTIVHGYANGTYVVSFIHAQGLSLQSVSVTVVVDDFESQPIISFEDDSIVCDQFADTYTWYFNEMTIFETESNFIEFDSFSYGSYACKLTRQSGCFATSNELVVTSMFENESPQVQVYPTCVSEGFLIRNYTGQVFVFDSFGAQILSEYMYQEKRIDFSSVSSGIYFVKTGETITKIVKNN